MNVASGQTPSSRGARAVAFALKAALLTLALCALAYLPVRAWVGAEALRALGCAAAAAYAGALLGHGAGLLLPRRRPESAAQAAFLALGVRLMATVLLAFVLLRAVEPPAPPFALVLGALYLALLVLEVGEALAEVRGGSPGLPVPPSPRGGANA